ncbi:type II toxin-antitoxin system RelE/ParE family toxin [Avibacterium avium]|uniref:type II toxin-antitoxin system RelE/ParE family toxin n=1 Tax=Avibacterium avium TaxID=751 RepID=UPI003BF803FB
MIKSFKHKDLQQYFEKGITKGLRADHLRKIGGILDLIDRSTDVADFQMLYQCHKLKGDREGIWSMTVSGNWWITFEFINGDAYILNYEDYH